MATRIFINYRNIPRAEYYAPTGNHLDFKEDNVISNKTSAYTRTTHFLVRRSRACFSCRLLRSPFFPRARASAALRLTRSNDLRGRKPYDRYTRVFIAELLRKFIVRRFRRPRTRDGNRIILRAEASRRVGVKLSGKRVLRSISKTDKFIAR